MAAQKSLLKVYGDRAYRHVTMARHQGTTIAFAMDAARRIVYSVLDLAGPPTKGDVDSAYWSDNPAELAFPREIAEVGYAVVGATAMPTVKRGGAEAAPEEQPAEEEVDQHLSSTGRLTGDAPFQVVSDGTYVVVLRQSIGAGDAGAVYKLAGGGSSGDASRADFVLDGGGAKVPLVRDTLLCDRFVLVDGKLKPVLEARFKRSRHATRPESAKDSLGTEDMEGRPFHEPTQELSFVRNLTQGRFAAVLVPTGVAGAQRWQLFAHNDATGRIDGFNIEQGAQGLFNTQGTRFYTSPDPAFRDAVFERSPGVCPFTGLDLVPVASEGGHAETALRLDGAGAYVDLGDPAALRFGGKAYSVEAWVKPAAPEGPLLGRAGEFQLSLDASGALRLIHEGAPAALVATATLAVDVYTHVAATFDGTTAKLYVNGRAAGSSPLPFTPGARGPVLVGRQDAGGTLRHFTGDVDELRIWSRVRSAAELAEELGHRLIGNEPGLAAYYRFDEGTGTTAYDQSDDGLHGRIEGAAQWTGSDAPIGDHPGVRRDSFVLKGRTVVSGMSAALYHQQENVVSGYRAEPKPAKRQARVLLAFAAKYGQEPCLAALDFAVGRDGRLAQAPDVLDPQVLKRPTRGQDSEQISTLQQVIKRLESEVAALPPEITRLGGVTTLLPQRQAAQAALQPQYDGYEAAYISEAWQPGAWYYTLELKTPRVIGGKTVRWAYANLGLGGVDFTDDDGPRTSWRLGGVDPRHADSLPFCLASTDSMGYPFLLSSNNDVPGFYGQLGIAQGVSATVNVNLPKCRFTLIREGEYVRIVNQASGMAIGLPADSRSARLSQAYECRSADTGLFRLNKTSMLSGTDARFFAVKEKMDAARAAVQESLAASRLIAERQLELASKRAELIAAQDQLASLSSALQGDDDLTLPMPPLAVDATGLSLNGALLEFARGSDRPALLDSGTGNLVLYFRGTDDQFSAVYYDTAVIRGRQTLDGDGGTLAFLARDPALPLGGCTITVSDGDAPGRCDLTITAGAETETWRSLPRKADRFAAALDGDPGRPVTVGMVARVSGATVELAEATTAVLPAKAHLQIGSAGCAVAADTPAGAKTLTLTAALSTLKPGDKVSVVGYDWGRADSTRPGVLLSAGSRLVGLNPGGVEFVPNGTARPAIAGRGCRWRAEMPGRAFQFSGGDQYLTLPTGKHLGITPSGDLTVEAWVNPENGQGRVLHARTDDSGYALSLVPAGLPAKQFAGAEKLELASSLDLAGRDFTIELWAKRNQSRGRTEPLLTHGTPGGGRDQALHLVFDPAETFRFGLYGDDLVTAEPYPDLEWHHWAAVYNNATREQILYRDGVEVGRRTATGPYTGNGPLVIGCQPFSGAYLDGRIDEVRVFDRARTQREIAADRDRRLSGREPGLLGHWTFDGPSSPPSPIKGYQVVARVGDRVVKSAERFPCNDWTHLAAAFTQSWALRMDSAPGLSVESQDALNLVEDLTIEAFVRIDRLGTAMGLVAKGSVVDGGQTGVPYQFGVLADGRLEFAFAEADGKAVRFTSTQALTPGTVQKVSVVRERRQPAPATTATGTQPTAPDQPEQYIRFFIGNTLVGNHLYNGPGAQTNNGELEIGRGLTGVLSEVRIWNAVRAPGQVGLPVTPREKGLLARWAFDENTGNVTVDHSGSFPAKLRGARWTRDPDPAASPLRLYRNGEPLAEGPVTAQDSAPWGEAQLTLGARLEGGKPADPFTGTLEEVRIWRTVRTAEQISDNLFSRLRGDKQDLLGYWPFDRDSTEPGTTSVRDEGLRGNHLAFSAKRPRILLSTAPISTDTAQVRSALAGVRTPFHDTIGGGPAASEYADLQYDTKGEALGLLKRCYGFVRDGRWHLVTGYKVGDLTTEWVGQAQFDPQLVGYIEGAPPVPSENLIDGIGDHAGASSVEFTEAEEVVQSLSSSKSRSTDTAFNFSISLETEADVMTVTAPLGVGIAKPLAEGQMNFGATTSLETSNTWSSDTQVSQGTNTSRKTKLALTGYPEDPAKLVNPTLGRRYVPANTGMALVQSQTADVFALRLAHTGTLIAYRMMPNPDIPLDWNIIHFPINPRYTKQGTLDGAVGFDDRGKVTDPDYPTATAYGEYSYFKPRDAYALKRRITRDQQRLQAYYQSISETGRNGENDPVEAQARTVLRGMGMDVAPRDDSRSGGPSATAGGFSHRGLVNTYVWTAQGGFFAETTEATDAVSETTTGSYSFHGMAGGSMDLSFGFIGLGWGIHLDASGGGGYSTTRAKGKDASRSFGLDVQCTPSGDLQRRDTNGTLVYDAAGRPALVPGKVDAYRFLSFYLGETSANFDDFYRKVVDPIWLQSSNAPDAAALRQAQQSSAKPPCWRILHRVTYVSRVLPPVPPPGAPPLEKAMRAENIDSNYELIRRLEPYVRPAATSTGALATATRQVLATELPELLPHAVEIIDYLGRYFGIDD